MKYFATYARGITMKFVTGGVCVERRRVGGADGDWLDVLNEAGTMIRWKRGYWGMGLENQDWLVSGEYMLKFTMILNTPQAEEQRSQAVVGEDPFYSGLRNRRLPCPDGGSNPLNHKTRDFRDLFGQSLRLRPPEHDNDHSR